MPGGGAVVLLGCSGRAQALIGAGAEGFAPLLFVKVLISVLLELDLWPPFVDIFNILLRSTKLLTLTVLTYVLMKYQSKMILLKTIDMIKM